MKYNFSHSILREVAFYMSYMYKNITGSLEYLRTRYGVLLYHCHDRIHQFNRIRKLRYFLISSEKEIRNDEIRLDLQFQLFPLNESGAQDPYKIIELKVHDVIVNFMILND